MADRFVSPITDIKPLGSLYFFKSGTNSPAVTYADESENIPNQAKIHVDASGNLPNVFTVGSVKVVYLDEFDNQYAARDPVGGDKALGDFTLWDATVTYDLKDIVEGSDREFYKSLIDTNQANDPTTEDAKWELIKLRGVWNTNVVYSVGDAVQTPDGTLWKPVIGNQGNDPENDDGTNWLPAVDGAKIPEIIKLTWINKSADFTAISGESYNIDGSSNTVDVTMPSVAEGEHYTFHNESISTNKVQILNTSYTIKASGGDISPGTDLELEAGNSVQMVAKSTAVLEIVGVQV